MKRITSPGCRPSSWFGLSAYTDIGGFGVRSDPIWQILSTFDWRAWDQAALRAVWRHLALDFQSGRLSLDTSLSGPIFGATIRF